MAYATSNPPKLLMGAFTQGNGPSIWSYDSTDAAADVDAPGYVTNGEALGMVAGDIVLVTDTNASPVIITSHRVTEVNADGSVDISQGDTFVTGTAGS